MVFAALIGSERGKWLEWRLGTGDGYGVISGTPAADDQTLKTF
jgi:hypothetical protein